MKAKCPLILAVLACALITGFGGDLPAVALPALRMPSVPVPESQVVGPPIDFSDDQLPNDYPALAYDGQHGEYLALWTTRQFPNTRDIWARRVSATGQLMNPFSVATYAGHYCYQPRAAYNPRQDEYLVVYNCWQGSKNYDVFANRVRWDGGLVPGGAITVAATAEAEMYPAVAFNDQDDEYLVAWTRMSDLSKASLWVRRVRANDGTLVADEVQVAGAPDEERAMADVAYNPARNQYLIAYLFEAAAPADVRARLVSHDLVDFSPEILLRQHTDELHALPPEVAAGTDEYLVVWPVRYLNAPPPATEKIDLYAQRIGGAGIPMGSHHGAQISADQVFDEHYYPDVAHAAGYGYLVVSCYAASTGWYADTYGYHVGERMDVAKGGAFLIDGDEGAQCNPAVACAPAGDCLVAETYQPSPQANTEIAGRFVRPATLARADLARSSNSNQAPDAKAEITLRTAGVD